MRKGSHIRDKEHFARIPEDVMIGPALATAPHAAFRVLAILVVGKAKEKNGTMMCTDSYAAKFGLKSHGTVQAALTLLEKRGLIITTRRVQRMKRFAALYAVTWWPNYNRDGQPLTTPESPTHAYRNFAPIMRVKKSKPKLDCSPRLSGDIAPIMRVETSIHHPDLPPNSSFDHPDNRANSKSLPQGPSALARSGAGGLCLVRASADSSGLTPDHINSVEHSNANVPRQETR